MAGANHFSFKPPHGVAIGLCLALLGGCAGEGGLLSTDLRPTTMGAATDVVPAAAPVQQAAPVANLRPTIIIPAAAMPERLPAWCDYLREDTAAQTTIMRAPSLNGSMKDDGKASLSLGLSLTDLGKASVLEQSAEVRCRKYMAETGLQKLVFLSPQGLTSAGYRAKADAILSHRKDIQSLRNQVQRAMASGDLDREKATGLLGAADQLLASASEAKSQADRRTGDFLGSKDKASVLGRELLRAEADLEDLNSRMRTFDAMDVSVSAGWSDDVNQSGLDVTDEGFTGKVSFSMKLGALAPSRFAHEQNAKAAKLRAIRDEEGGALWQVNVLRLAHERAIEGLVQSRNTLDSAIADAGKLLAALNGVENPEFAATRISARLQLLRLKSDRAAVDGSISEIRANLQRLKTTG